MRGRRGVHGSSYLKHSVGMFSVNMPCSYWIKTPRATWFKICRLHTDQGHQDHRLNCKNIQLLLLQYRFWLTTFASIASGERLVSCRIVCFVLLVWVGKELVSNRSKLKRQSVHMSENKELDKVHDVRFVLLRIRVTFICVPFKTSGTWSAKIIGWLRQWFKIVWRPISWHL